MRENLCDTIGSYLVVSTYTGIFKLSIWDVGIHQNKIESLGREICLILISTDKFPFRWTYQKFNRNSEIYQNSTESDLRTSTYYTPNKSIWWFSDWLVVSCIYYLFSLEGRRLNQANTTHNICCSTFSK